MTFVLREESLANDLLVFYIYCLFAGCNEGNLLHELRLSMQTQPFEMAVTGEIFTTELRSPVATSASSASISVSFHLQGVSLAT